MSTQLSEHVLETPSVVAVKPLPPTKEAMARLAAAKPKLRNPRQAAQKLVAGMIKARQAAGQSPVIAPTSKPTAKVAVKPAKPAKVTQVTLRRHAKLGRYLLIINPAIFGSTGDNWFGGAKATYETKELALAAAAKAGLKVLNV